MPLVPPTVSKELAAVLIADLHLSEKPPVARSVEKNWFECMARQLQELQVATKSVPVLLAGDLFHVWNSSANLINFALEHLPDRLYAVPGNHDLPNHRLADIRRSAFWTLVQAGKINLVDPDETTCIGSPTPLRIWGYPCGYSVHPLERPYDLVLEIALVHEYLWVPNKGYQGAPAEQRLKNCGKRFTGYDVVVVGDNHQSFMAKVGKTNIMNVGGFYRRHADEIDHRPSVGLLFSDGSVTRHYLDVSQDQFLPEDELKKKSVVGGVDVTPFVDAVGSLQHSVVDFETEVRRHVERDEIKPLVKKIILQALEKTQ